MILVGGTKLIRGNGNAFFGKLRGRMGQIGRDKGAGIKRGWY